MIWYELLSFYALFIVIVFLERIIWFQSGLVLLLFSIDRRGSFKSMTINTHHSISTLSHRTKLRSFSCFISPHTVHKTNFCLYNFSFLMLAQALFRVLSFLTFLFSSAFFLSLVARKIYFFMKLCQKWLLLKKASFFREVATEDSVFHSRQQKHQKLLFDVLLALETCRTLDYFSCQDL